MLNSLLAWITIDPDPIFFTIPFINHPIAWYGCIFALAFYLGFKIFIWMYTRHILDSINIDKQFKDIVVPMGHVFSKEHQKLYAFYAARVRDEKKLSRLKLQLYLEETESTVISIKSKAVKFSESALIYIILATIIGARLGHIIFYENIMEYLYSPLEIIKTWEGGLASHGGIAAILIAAFIFVRKNKSISFLTFMDIIAAPTMFVCAWIRIGNFINQEILGGASTLPWAIIFRHPADGGAIVPRHPMQLYEFILYMAVSILLFSLWKKFAYQKRDGFCLGIVLIISFSARFFLEFLKVPQSVYDTANSLQIGQLLSLPMILLGVVFLIFSRNKKVDLDKKLSEF
ncbi:MAG: Phosphatidylglycerol--prolipoprotein diacylglyceryl transferase [Chlamydiia bacterium]|nr:Phosphatidylglycerol--prolipoprotein diacylglyceryl transferase [Chlamydiia bacterium]